MIQNKSFCDQSSSMENSSSVERTESSSESFTKSSGPESLCVTGDSDDEFSPTIVDLKDVSSTPPCETVRAKSDNFRACLHQETQKGTCLSHVILSHVSETGCSGVLSLAHSTLLTSSIINIYM